MPPNRYQMTDSLEVIAYSRSLLDRDVCIARALLVICRVAIGKRRHGRTASLLQMFAPYKSSSIYVGADERKLVG